MKKFFENIHDIIPSKAAVASMMVVHAPCFLFPILIGAGVSATSWLHDIHDWRFALGIGVPMLVTTALQPAIQEPIKKTLGIAPKKSCGCQQPCSCAPSCHCGPTTQSGWRPRQMVMTLALATGISFGVDAMMTTPEQTSRSWVDPETGKTYVIQKNSLCTPGVPVVYDTLEVMSP